jgi:DUF4097 and DUF4098 domain-containing protein YvlB
MKTLAQPPADVRTSRLLRERLSAVPGLLFASAAGKVFHGVARIEREVALDSGRGKLATVNGMWDIARSREAHTVNGKVTDVNGTARPIDFGAFNGNNYILNRGKKS